MTDLASAVGDLLATRPSMVATPTCHWCGQEWTASSTTNCRHFSPGAGRCQDCGRQWSGSREAHCAACHRHFSSDSAFALHQHIEHGPCDAGGEHGRTCRAISVCHDPKRLVEVQTPDGPMWAHPGKRPPESIPERSAP